MQRDDSSASSLARHAVLCPRGIVLLLLALLGSAAQQASAQTPPREAALTLYGALRDGGNFVDAPSGRKVGIEASGAAAVSLDLGLDVSRQLQFYV